MKEEWVRLEIQLVAMNLTLVRILVQLEEIAKQA